MATPFAKVVANALERIPTMTSIQDLSNIINPAEIEDELEAAATNLMEEEEGFDDADIEYFKRIYMAASAVLMRAQSQYLTARLQDLPRDLQDQSLAPKSSSVAHRRTSLAKKHKIAPKPCTKVAPIQSNNVTKSAADRNRKHQWSLQTRTSDGPQSRKDGSNDILSPTDTTASADDGRSDEQMSRPAKRIKLSQSSIPTPSLSDPTEASTNNTAESDDSDHAVLEAIPSIRETKTAPQIEPAAAKTGVSMKSKATPSTAPQTDQKDTFDTWRPFECHICGNGYKSKDAVYNHFALKHKTEGYEWNRKDVIKVPDPDSRHTKTPSST